VTRPAREGPTKRHLEQLVTRASRAQGTTAARLRRWVSAMVLLGALERAERDGGPQFVLKGGVAIELRLRTGARATQDVDIIFRGRPNELLSALDDALAEPYREFTFQRGEPADRGPHARRFEVRLSYQTRPWSTVRLEVSRPDADGAEIERVAAIGLEHFKLSGPHEIACLPLRFQIAQKLHAVTERPTGRENRRFRDLVDLLILRDLADDLVALRRACEDTFQQRATHAWPPELVVPGSWRSGYAELAAEVGLDVRDVDAAAGELRVFLADIASA
jgi:hypothetical protein